MKTLHRKIRHAEEVNNPSLFSYLLEGELSEGENKTKQKNILLTQFQLLLETIKDEEIPFHWRQQCLDHINKPLLLLQRIAANDEEKFEVKKLFHQLKTTSSYLQENL